MTSNKEEKPGATFDLNPMVSVETNIIMPSGESDGNSLVVGKIEQLSNDVSAGSKIPRKSKPQVSDTTKVNFDVLNHIPVGIYKTDHTVPDLKYATEGSRCFDIRAHLLEGSEIQGYNSLNEKVIKRVARYSISNQVPEGQVAVAIEPGERLLIPTGYIFDLPDNWSLLLYPRSGVSLKQGLKLSNCVGVVDTDYVDPTFMILENTASVRVLIMHGDAYAQGDFVSNSLRSRFDYLSVPPQKKTTRNGGFGSTGK